MSANDVHSPEELTIRYLIGQGEEKSKYTIPIYQRNYAWGEEEIIQLLTDIFDMKKTSGNNKYYIGSLVVQQKENSCYEVVDGQQRLTTLAVISAVLGIEVENSIHSWLSFQSRIRSENALVWSLKNKIDSEVECVDCNDAIIAAYNIVSNWIEQNIKEKQKFKDYLLNNVTLIRVCLPEHTDLNHYFEVMNNRGEQLEKHEIIKARILNKLEEEDRPVAAKIWDACAEMDGYLVKELREVNKSENIWTQFYHDEESAGKNRDNSSFSLKAILETSSVEKKPVKKNIKDKNHRYKSIINFPNFLLVALYLFNITESIQKKETVLLDDKSLISEFEKTILTDTNNCRGFIEALYNYRVMFDKYIIKRELVEDMPGDYKWSLKKYQNDDSSFKNTFDNNNAELISILSMLNVSYSSQSGKYWLVAALKWLRTNEGEFGKEYLVSLETVATIIASNILKDGSVKSYDEILLNSHQVIIPFEISSLNSCYVLNKGTKTPHFLFHWLDYLLWVKLKDKDSTLQATKVKEMLCSCDSDFVDEVCKKSYKFSFRSSVEHYHPQNPDSENTDKNWDKKHLDSFGNLCLIGSSWNSSLSNKSVGEKKEQTKARINLVSIKQVLMMSCNKWSESSCESHQNNMIKIIRDALISNKVQAVISYGD